MSSHVAVSFAPCLISVFGPHHDAQDAARAARRSDFVAEAQHAQAINKSVFPGIQGGPFMHIIAAKAAAFGEALRPAFAAYQQQVVVNARVMGEELQRAGVRLVRMCCSRACSVST